MARVRKNTKVEKTLMRKVPKDEWSATHHRLIFFGRYHCKARTPNCNDCELLSLCCLVQNKS